MPNHRELPPAARYFYEHVTIDMGRRTATNSAHPDLPVRLTGKVYRLLDTVLTHPGWVYTYHQLVRAVGSSPAGGMRHYEHSRDSQLNSADKHAMHALVNRVRVALGEKPRGRSIIVNFDDDGYAIERPLYVIRDDPKDDTFAVTMSPAMVTPVLAHQLVTTRDDMK